MFFIISKTNLLIDQIKFRLHHCLKFVWSPYHIQNSPLICSANQWTGFYLIGTSVMEELISSNKKSIWFLEFYFVFRTHSMQRFTIFSSKSWFISSQNFYCARWYYAWAFQCRSKYILSNILKNGNGYNHHLWIFILLGGNSLQTGNLINNDLHVIARCAEPIFKVSKGFFNFYLDFSNI